MVTSDNLQTAKANDMECGILALDGDTIEPNVIGGRTFHQFYRREREVDAMNILVI